MPYPIYTIFDGPKFGPISYSHTPIRTPPVRMPFAHKSANGNSCNINGLQREYFYSHPYSHGGVRINHSHKKVRINDINDLRRILPFAHQPLSLKRERGGLYTPLSPLSGESLSRRKNTTIVFP